MNVDYNRYHEADLPQCDCCGVYQTHVGLCGPCAAAHESVELVALDTEQEPLDLLGIDPAAQPATPTITLESLVVALAASGKVTYRFDYLDEDVPVRGNVMASGDDACDAKCEDEVIDRLSRGDLCAWFCAKCTATIGQFSGVDVLGACSWDSFEQFERDCGDDMKAEALQRLASELLAAHQVLRLLVESRCGQ